MSSNAETLEYIEGFLTPASPVLADVEQQAEGRDDVAPSIGPHVGAFLGWLVRTMGARRVLEIGTCLGYSTITLAAAVAETDGRLTAVEISPALADETRRNLTSAGLADRVDVIVGDATDVLAELEGPFDVILQGADKPLYPKLLGRCVDLLRPGGVLCADNALFVPMGVDEKHSRPVHEYNELIFSDSRLHSTILPIGDGLAISTRR